MLVLTELLLIFFSTRQVNTLWQAPYSPNLNLCDRWLFSRLKRSLEHMEFNNHEEVQSQTLQLIQSIPQNEFQKEHASFLITDFVSALCQIYVFGLSWIISHLFFDTPCIKTNYCRHCTSDSYFKIRTVETLCTLHNNYCTLLNKFWQTLLDSKKNIYSKCWNNNNNKVYIFKMS